MRVSMIKYLNNVLHESPEHHRTPSSSPYYEYIFKVRPESEAKYPPKNRNKCYIIQWHISYLFRHEIDVIFRWILYY